MLRIKKVLGQSTAEYAILIGVVIAALIAMSTFVGRNIKAKVHDATTYSDPALKGTVFDISQYEPEISGTTTTNRYSGAGEAMTDLGEYSRSNISENTESSGNRYIPGI